MVDGARPAVESLGVGFAWSQLGTRPQLASTNQAVRQVGLVKGRCLPIRPSHWGCHTKRVRTWHTPLRSGPPLRVP